MSEAADRYERAGDILADAMEIEPGEREAFLEEACGDDSDLRAEVDRLIAYADSDAAAPGVGLKLVESVVRQDMIGEYRVVRAIGQGGMGTVYLAEQVNPRRQVAIKMIRRGVTSRDALRRFHHEAAILGQMKHPGIAHVYEAGLHDAGDGGQPFFAMEYVEGVSLTKYATANDLSVRERLDLFAQICDAVHHAHQRSVIHRDLKPDNILVTARGEPKILDFGVARVTEGDLKVTTIQTSVGQLIGTLAYMSPEQVSGNAVSIDTRSDVYALGVVLFELLTGRLPHESSSGGVPEMIRAIQLDEPTRLQTIDTRYRGDVDTIVCKATEKDPDRRYASAADMAADIRRHLSDEPITARQASRMYHMRKFARRNRALVIGVAGTIAALLLGVVVSILFALNAARHADLSARTSYRMAIENAMVHARAGDDAAARQSLDATIPAYRHWEWHYVANQLKRVVPDATVRRETTLTMSSFTLDGAAFAAVCLTDHVGVFDLDSGEEVYRICEGSEFEALRSRRGMLFPQFIDGSRLVTWTAVPDQPGVLQWDLTSATHSAFAPGSLSNDGATRATLVGESWFFTDVASGASRRFSSESLINIPVFSHDGSRAAFVVADEDKAPPTRHLVVVDVSSGQSVRRRPIEPRSSWVWSPSDALLASDGHHSTIVVSADTLETIVDVPRTAVADYRGRGLASAFLGEDHLLRPGDEGGVDIVSFDDGSVRSFLTTPPTATVGDIVVSADRQRVIVGGPGWAQLHDIGAPKGSIVLADHTSYVYTHAWNGDGTVLATGAWDGTIRFWDAHSGASLGAFTVGDESARPRPCGLQFTDGDRVLEVIGLGEGVNRQRWDLGLGHRILDEEIELNAFLGVAPAGMRLDGSTPTSVGRFAGDYRVVSPDGRYAASYVNGATSILDRRSGAVIAALDESEQVCGFNGDSSRVVTGDRAGVLRLHDLTGKLIAEKKVHSSETFALVFSPDGRRLVSSGRDGARVCDAETLDVLLKLDAHDDYVRSASFSPDGTRIVTTSGDHTVRIWDSIPYRERLALSESATALRARMASTVDELLANMDGGAAWEHIMGDALMSDAERSAALFALMMRGLGNAPSSERATRVSGW